MAVRRKSGGVGDRVLESKHVIGLFALLLVFSLLFFALGFVMGRSQYDGNVLAAHPLKNGLPDPFAAPKPLPGKHNNSYGVSAANPAPSSSETPPASNPGWDIHEYDDAKRGSDRLEQPPPPTITSQKNPPAVVKNTAVVVTPRNKPATAPLIPTGSFTLQVAALKSQADALDLASRLQKQKFPAFVVTPQGDKFYRVQVGPFPDQKSADAAKKGLDAAGFKAIVKH